jgi:hypothetical protein
VIAQKFELQIVIQRLEPLPWHDESLSVLGFYASLQLGKHHRNIRDTPFLEVGLIHDAPPSSMISTSLSLPRLVVRLTTSPLACGQSHLASHTLGQNLE